MKLELHGVRLQAGEFSLEIDAEFTGRVTGLFGPSGSGKSTLVEIVAGLRRPSAGRVILDGNVLVDIARGFFLPPEKRRIGYVPQDGALFPHLSVEGNLRFAESRSRAADEQAFARSQIGDLLGIGGLLDRNVTSLSGGERQRVALARALVSSPQLLLLDEPLAALDAARKAAILPYLQRIRDEFDLPMLYVSHAAEEVMAMADNLAVMCAGRMLQHGAVGAVFRQPTNHDVAHIVGVETVQPAVVLEMSDGLATVALGTARLAALAEGLPPGTTNVLVSIRADDVILFQSGGTWQTSARNQLTGTVTAIATEGATMRIEVDCGFPLVAVLTRQSVEQLGLTVGGPICALVKAPNVHLIPRGS